MADSCGEDPGHVNRAAALSQFSHCVIYFSVDINYGSLMCAMHGGAYAWCIFACAHW